MLRKNFKKSMGKQLESLDTFMPYFVVTNQKSFKKSFMVVKPEYFVSLLTKAGEEAQAHQLKNKLEDMWDAVSQNSKAKANKRWMNEKNS